MPELPEVEIARRVLERELLGARVSRLFVRDARLVEAERATPRTPRGLVGLTAVAIDRRGKWLRLTFAPAAGGAPEAFVRYAFSHLRMTGKWCAVGASDAPLPAERLRVVATRSGESRAAAFVDPRRFGRFLVTTTRLDDWDALGPDPLLDGLDPKRVHAALASRTRPIKEALLDQTLIAGIGNIQAQEALFRARIAPHTPAHALSAAAVARLCRAIHASIVHTLAASGDVPGSVTYVSEAGGRERSPFLVYRRGGTPCPRCGTLLVAEALGGRGTVWCPRCQPARP
jgi:formamidopyrimidine-DNA glycosylase